VITLRTPLLRVIPLIYIITHFLKNSTLLEERKLKMKEDVIKYFMNGYSCSESIVKYAIDKGLCPENLLSCATSFSGGMSSGCVCGAVAGAQMVLGYIYGRDNIFSNELCAREKAKELVEKFKERNKVTCCKILTAGLEGMQRKEHCCKMVSDCAEILEELARVKV